MNTQGMYKSRTLSLDTVLFKYESHHELTKRHTYTVNSRYIEVEGTLLITSI